jgi:hypothetical protein
MFRFEEPVDLHSFVIFDQDGPDAMKTSVSKARGARDFYSAPSTYPASLAFNRSTLHPEHTTSTRTRQATTAFEPSS